MDKNTMDSADNTTKTILIIVSLIFIFFVASLLLILPKRAPGPVVPGTIESSAREETGIAGPPGANETAANEIIPSYASQEVCEEATKMACHYASCEGGTESGCVTGSAGWQAIAPGPDKTSIPEKIDAPLGSLPDVPETDSNRIEE